MKKQIVTKLEDDEDNITSEDVTRLYNLIQNRGYNFWNDDYQLLHKVLAFFKTMEKQTQ